MSEIPTDFPVQPLSIGHPRAIAGCGTCGLWWDDDISTSLTPVPSGRCPFEYFHSSIRWIHWDDVDCGYLCETISSNSIATCYTHNYQYLIPSMDEIFDV